MKQPKRSIIHRIFSASRCRLVQRLLGVHRIHDVRWSFGWTFPLVRRSAYFEKYGWQALSRHGYHDSTATGRY